jgi:hypothetical protein
MIHNKIYHFLLSNRILTLRLIGTKLEKQLIETAGKYYRLLHQGMVHEDAIANIIKEEYPENKHDQEEAKHFIYSKKQPIDKEFDSKYGKRGRFMSHLFKLVQKIHLDKNSDKMKMNNSEYLSLVSIKLNRKFNKVVLYMFAKYQ